MIANIRSVIDLLPNYNYSTFSIAAWIEKLIYFV